jgi:hypothetical protein
MVNGFRRRGVALAAASLVSAASWVAVAAPVAGRAVVPSAAPGASSIPSAVPASFTPMVKDGIIYSVVQVGSTVFMGGTFTSVTSHDGKVTAPSQLMVGFTAGTGALVTGFNPAIVGSQVSSVIAGPMPNTVYVAGTITSVDGVKTHVALLNASTGAIVPGWKAATMNGAANALALTNGQLLVGGDFTTVGGASRVSFASLDPMTGALTNYAQINLTGHHNYGVNPGTADGTIGVKYLAVNPAGTQAVMTGDFTTATDSGGTVVRDQIVKLNLSGSSATIDRSWATAAFSSPCNANSFDSYIRGVSFAPDGSYFVVAATGGARTKANSDGSRGLCDSASRFDPNVNDTDVAPTWVDYTGRDTIWQATATAAAVYVGGHERWLNNTKGQDNPQEGAVPRPSIAALDPVNGLPLSWNPGRNPRGGGTHAIYLTNDGLYIGGDQDYVGNFKYHVGKLAFFPFTGGETLAANTTPSLPGNVYTAGAFTGNTDRFSVRHFNGTTAGTETTRTTGVAWSAIRGAFTVNGEMVYGKSDGKLYERSFDGTTVGPEVALDPYDDPAWDNVQTGSGQTYQGTAPSLFGTEMTNVTSMFYTDGRLYYTDAGVKGMHWRWFEPDSGIVGADEFTTNDTNSWANVAGAFLSGNTLYFADKSSGQLKSVAWSGTRPTGTSQVVPTGQTDWASRGMFLLTDTGVPQNQPPVASFTSSCSSTDDSCTFDASSSRDPDGSISGFDWTFGSDPTEHHPDSSIFTHTFPSDGTFSVALTVTDNDGATDTETTQVTVGPQQQATAPTYKAALTACGPGTGACGKSNVTNVGVPATTAAGDTLLLFVSRVNSATSVSVPAGWTLLGKDVNSPMEADVYSRTASATDAGTTVAVTFGAALKNAVTLADYTGADPTIEGFGTRSDAIVASHTTPNVAVTADNSLAISYWTDKSSSTTSWTLPAGVRSDAQYIGIGGGSSSSVLGDSVSPVGVGSYGSQTASTNAPGGKATNWTIILAPAG